MLIHIPKQKYIVGLTVKQFEPYCSYYLIISMPELLSFVQWGFSALPARRKGPCPHRAAARGVGRHLRAGLATAAPGGGAGNPRGFPTKGWERLRVGEPGGAVTAGEAAAGAARGGVSPRRRFSHPLSPFGTETAQAKLLLPRSVPLSAGGMLPVLPRSFCFTAQAGSREQQLPKAERAQRPWLFIRAFAIERKDAFPSPLCEYLKRRCQGQAVSTCCEFGYSLTALICR